jgi:hypothetical protein
MRRTSCVDQRSALEGGRRLVCVVADHHHHGERKPGQRYVAMPSMPGSGLLWSRPSSFLVVSKLSSIAQRWHSTCTSALIPVPAEHQIVKNASPPSAICRRISKSRIHIPGRPSP